MWKCTNNHFNWEHLWAVYKSIKAKNSLRVYENLFFPSIKSSYSHSKTFTNSNNSINARIVDSREDTSFILHEYFSPKNKTLWFSAINWNVLINYTSSVNVLKVSRDEGGKKFQLKRAENVKTLPFAVAPYEELKSQRHFMSNILR
jgi:hypothetical protein